MIVDGVNFNEKAIKGQSLGAFLDKHIDAFWKNRERSVRRQILTDVYYRINPKPKKEEPVTETEK